MEPTIYKPSIYNGAGIYNTGAESGGGGDAPVPEEYKELMYIATDVDVNTNYTSNGSFTSLGGFRTDSKIFVSLFDFTLIKQWLINNNKSSALIYLMSQVDGKQRYFMYQYDGTNQKGTYFVQGAGAGSVVNFSPSIEYIVMTKSDVAIGNILFNAGGGSPSYGASNSFYPFGSGTDIPPAKCGKIKIYDSNDVLIKDWRPVEKIGAGNNRFGFYDTINNVFRNSIRSGHYFIGGPEIL